MKEALLLPFLLLLQAKAQDGSLDPNFGIGGFVRLNQTFAGTTFTSDGKLVAVTSGRIYRYNTDGTPDVSFGIGGFITTRYTTSTNDKQVAVQKDGKILVTGTISIPDPTIPLLSSSYQVFERFDSDGTPDTTFGDNGAVLVLRGRSDNSRLPGVQAIFLSNVNEIFYILLFPSPGGRSYGIRRLSASGETLPATVFAGALTLFNSSGSYREPFSIAFQDDGKILVGGYELGYIPGTTQVAQRGLLVRYNNDGTLDQTFGTNGVVALDVSNGITNLTLQNDGKIVGTIANSIVRFNADGGLDTSFGNNGTVIAGMVIKNIKVQDNGKIIIGGDSDGSFVFKRFNSNGTLDSTFGSGGTTTSDFDGSVILENMVIAGNRLYAYGFGILAAYQLNNTPCTPPTFLNTLSIMKAAACGQNDGALYLIPTSGTPPFQYSRDGGQTYISGPNSGYSFEGLAAGTYRLRLKDASGCESAVVPRTIRTVYNGPTFLNDQTIVLDASCQGRDGSISVVPLSGTAPFLYSIDDGVTYVSGPAQGYTFQGLAAGNYTLRLRDAQGCESAPVQRYVRPNAYGTCATAQGLTPRSAGAVEQQEAAPLRAYPNPNKGQFRLQLTGLASEKVHVQVLNSKGQVIEQRRVNVSESNSVDFDLTQKAKGLYLIRVMSEKGTQMSKVMLQ